MNERMPLADLLRDYSDGDERGWQAEFDWLDGNDAGRMDMLTTSIQETGIREPILLGDDGRVWDGHHRIAVAHRLGLDCVPVRHASVEDEARIARHSTAEQQGSDESGGGLTEAEPCVGVRRGCICRGCLGLPTQGDRRC